MSPKTRSVAMSADRLVHFRGHGFVPTAVWRRYALPPGADLAGPCVLEEPGATALVEPGMRLRVLPDGLLLNFTNNAP